MIFSIVFRDGIGNIVREALIEDCIASSHDRKTEQGLMNNMVGVFMSNSIMKVSSLLRDKANSS